jgi:C1A family cysteine protease
MAEVLDDRQPAAHAEKEAIRASETRRKGRGPVLVAPGQPVVLGAMGWLRDTPDLRDYTPDTQEVRVAHKAMGLYAPAAPAPASVDLRPWCTAIENQEALGSCTAHAGVGLYEYFIKRTSGAELDLSRSFLYKATRNLLQWTGDSGAFLRSTMGAMALFGTPPEEYWAYDVARFDAEPTAFCYAFAADFQALVYYRLDPGSVARDMLLVRIKSYLAAGLPSMFGFTVYNSISQAATTGKIPFPAAGDRVEGGHAVLAVGYDDAMKIKSTNPAAAETTGALLIRNSWGTGWGAAGYGWLPYEYVLRSLAVDWWSMLKGEWIPVGGFK